MNKHNMKKISHQLTENVKVLQKAVLIHGGKFLILKRSDDATSRPGKWDLPGGNMEWPEVQKDQTNLHEDEIIREIVEETGIIVNDFALESTYLSSYYQADKEILTLILGWSVQLFQQPEVKISAEHTEYAWIRAEELNSYDFGFAGEKDGFIRKIIEKSGGGGCCGGGCC